MFSRSVGLLPPPSVELSALWEPPSWSDGRVGAVDEVGDVGDVGEVCEVGEVGALPPVIEFRLLSSRNLRSLSEACNYPSSISAFGR